MHVDTRVVSSNCKQYVNVKVTCLQIMNAYGTQDLLIHLFITLV